MQAVQRLPILFTVMNTLKSLVRLEDRKLVHPMAFFHLPHPYQDYRFHDINNNYLDGVSISTNGQHVWSFAAGYNCHHTRNKPTLIGQDYTCGGVASSSYVGILWASQQCGRNSHWFYNVFPATITDIKVRICRNQFGSYEDLAITTLEPYTQYIYICLFTVICSIIQTG